MHNLPKLRYNKSKSKGVIYQHINMRDNMHIHIHMCEEKKEKKYYCGDIILIVGHEWHGAQVGCICALCCSGILITFQHDDQAFLVETDEILTFNLIYNRLVNSEQNVFVDAPRICGAVEKEQTLVISYYG